MTTYRYCHRCDGIHDVERWPHNCREPDYDVRANFATPALHAKFEPYRSMVGNHEWISSRNQRREDMKRNDCVEWSPGSSKATQKGRTPGKYNNPYYALKKGLPLSDKGEERLEAMRRDGRLEEFKRTKRRHKFPDKVYPRDAT